MLFVNRQSELDALHRWMGDREGRLAVVWGRRRVGKTALLQEFAKRHRAVFHTGAGRPAPAELALLARAAVAAGLRSGDLEDRAFRDWDDALDALA